MTFRIGIISDTHGLLRPEAERRLAGVDHIIHGGDIGRPEITPHRPGYRDPRKRGYRGLGRCIP
jgi:predicted phosphodiesterase